MARNVLSGRRPKGKIHMGEGRFIGGRQGVSEEFQRLTREIKTTDLTAHRFTDQKKIAKRAEKRTLKNAASPTETAQGGS